MEIPMIRGMEGEALKIERNQIHWIYEFRNNWIAAYPIPLEAFGGNYSCACGCIHCSGMVRKPKFHWHGDKICRDCSIAMLVRFCPGLDTAYVSPRSGARHKRYIGRDVIPDVFSAWRILCGSPNGWAVAKCKHIVFHVRIFSPGINRGHNTGCANG